MRSAASIVLVFALAACMTGSEPPVAPPTTTPGPAALQVPLGEPMERSAELKWAQLGEGLSHAHLDGPRQVVILEPSGKRMGIEAGLLFATAYNGAVWNVRVRPVWEHDTQARLAKRLEQQLGEWEVPIDERTRQFLQAMERVGDEAVPQIPSPTACNIRLNDQSWLGVRLNGVYKRGWFVVFEFSTDKRPK